VFGSSTSGPNLFAENSDVIRERLVQRPARAGDCFESIAHGWRCIETENEPNVLSLWNLLTIDAPLLWGQYWNTMDWLLIAMASAFAIVTAVLCVVCSRSPKEKRHERLIVYHRDGYEIEPAEVPEFNPTWRNERWGILSAAQPRHRNQKGGSRA